MPDSLGDAAQIRKILEQFREIDEEAKVKEPPLHPLIKWFLGAIGALGSAAIIGLGLWLVSSVSNMRETLARIDERQVMNAQNIADRFQAIDGRLARLEAQKEAHR